MYQILACGSNSAGQLGCGTQDDVAVFKKCVFGEENSESLTSEPRQVSCGGNHTLILFENGRCFSSGDNTHGQCGQSASCSIFNPIPGHNWKYVGCGWEFSVLVMRDDRVFVCGKGLRGELGLGESIHTTDLVELHLPISGRIVEVLCGVTHTILKFENGDLVGWGACRTHQLGNVGHGKKFLWTPQKLIFEELDAAQRYFIATSRDRTFILQPPNPLKVHGKKLAVDHKNVSGLDEVWDDRKSVISVQSMWSSIHVVYKSDNDVCLWSIGNNSHAQILSERLANVRSYAFGSEHGIALLKNNKVYTWGWGEHGNCGVDLTTKGCESGSSDQGTTTAANTHEGATAKNVYAVPNCIYEGGEEVKMIRGGCATTWIVLERDSREQ